MTVLHHSRAMTKTRQLQIYLWRLCLEFLCLWALMRSLCLCLLCQVLHTHVHIDNIIA